MTEGDLVWVGEMPVPSANREISEGIYVLEQWLRRIVYAALMAKGGSDWQRCLPENLQSEAKAQLRTSLKRRTFLDVENSDHLIWALTFDQLRQVLALPDLESFVFDLTATATRDLGSQMEALRDIRNVVAHNRAASDVALAIFEKRREKLGRAIDRFKLVLIYPDGAWENILFEERDEDGRLRERLERPRRFEIEDVFEESPLYDKYKVLMERRRFWEFANAFPEVSRHTFIDIGRLLDGCHEIRHALLAIVLPHPESDAQADSFSVLFPKDVSGTELEQVRDFVLAVRADSDVPYADQEAKFVCDPLIWFEQGYAGGRAAGSTFDPRIFRIVDPD